MPVITAALQIVILVLIVAQIYCARKADHWNRIAREQQRLRLDLVERRLEALEAVAR